MEFVGRDRDIAVLQAQLDGVAQDRSGRAIIITGRRRVGKSRLVQQFCDTSEVDSVVFQATRGRNPGAERADFIDAVASSGLKGASLVRGVQPTDWNQALRQLASVLPDDRPVIVVIDEVPWLAKEDRSFEGALQTVWDRYLMSKPVLLLLIGSDQSVMESLSDHDRPFFGRASTLRIEPLNPAEVQDMTGLSAVDAIDAWLITGGFPQIAASWGKGESRESFLARSLSDPLSPLLVSAELTLLGEFSQSTQTRAVLEAVGSGERTFSLIAREAGGGKPLASGTLAPVLATLIDKRVIAVDQPLSTVPDTRNKRYRIADPYLRFWLSFGAVALPLAERGLGRTGLDRVERSWQTWRGRAVEPLVRESVQRICLKHDIAGVDVVGNWWNRQNNPEVDLIGADRAPTAMKIGFVGSIKWRDQQPFTYHDCADLLKALPFIPGCEAAPLAAVSATGFDDGLPLIYQWNPEDIVEAWR